MNNLGNGVVNGNVQVVAQPSEQPAQVAQNTVTQQPVIMQQPIQNTQGLFTQEQLNSIISSRINPLNQKINELNTQLTQAQQLSQSYLNELTGFKNRECATKAGVPAQFVDFAVFEASKLAVDGKSFESAMKEYVDKNGSLFCLPSQSVQGNAGVTPSTEQPNGVVASAQQNTDVMQVQQTTTMSASKPELQPTQIGSSGLQATVSPAVSNLDSEVDAFLKAKGLKK